MLSTEQLIEESQDPRLQKLPIYARTLIHDLVQRLELTEAALRGTRTRAEQEVSEARALLTGPEDSDTFMTLPRAYLSEDGPDQRPLGTGTNIEFRHPGRESGEGFSVCLTNGELHIQGYTRLAVAPVHGMYLIVQERRA